MNTTNQVFAPRVALEFELYGWRTCYRFEYIDGEVIQNTSRRIPLFCPAVLISLVFIRNNPVVEMLQQFFQNNSMEDDGISIELADHMCYSVIGAQMDIFFK